MRQTGRRVLIVGGGYVGMYAALEMQRELSRAGHELTLVNLENYMQYQPFLPEVASGNIEPRHVVVPLRQILKKTTVLVGEVRRIDHERRVATVRTPNGEDLDVPYDVLVLGAGTAQDHSMISQMPDLTHGPARISGPPAFAMAGVRHEDVVRTAWGQFVFFWDPEGNPLQYYESAFVRPDADPERISG